MTTITENLPAVHPADVTAEFVSGSTGLVTAEQYLELVETGVIPRERRVERWDGRIVELMAKTLPHVAVHNALSRAIDRRLPRGMFVGNENPVRLDPTHLPLPDLVVVRGRPLDFYDTRYPDGRDVLLVVEVADTSLGADLGVRLRRYAATNHLAAYVVVDIPHRRLLVHEGPGLAGYERCTAVGPGEALHLKLEGVELQPIRFEQVMR